MSEQSDRSRPKEEEEYGDEGEGGENEPLINNSLPDQTALTNIMAGF
jgi:hypothetical protein